MSYKTLKAKSYKAIYNSARQDAIYKEVEGSSIDKVIYSLNEFWSVREWLPIENYSNREIKDLYLRLYSEGFTIQTPFNGFVKKVGPEQEKGTFYGSNLPTISELGIDALRICKAAVDNGTQAVFWDVGCGGGSMVWKALLAGCKVYALDVSFSDKAFREIFDFNVKSMVSEEVSENNLVTVSNSIYDLLSEYPEHIGSADVVYSARVLHFQAPMQLNGFASVIYDLSKPLANAFISTDSVNGLKILGKNCYTIYEYNRDHNHIAPGYVFKDGIRQSCHRKGKEIEALDTFPPHDYSNGGHKYYVATFDTDTLKTIFEEVGFETDEAYYMRGSNVLFVKYKDGKEAAAIKLTKPYTNDTYIDDMREEEVYADGGPQQHGDFFG